ncbi:MAG TPA: hypothetical protein VNZ02_03955 [Steroidobacteraceae bacterium]|nr:hypothetical protein [Steroidobacteraceae bacterium]
MYNTRMFRLAILLLFTLDVHAAIQAVDIDAAAQLYADAATREQVRASLLPMPAHIRQLFMGNTSSALSESQLAAVDAAAKRGFRIDVFEPAALRALAANLDADTVKKTEAFLASDLGRRMVAADVALATLDEDTINKVMDGKITAPSTPQRDALFWKLETATHSSESNVQIFLSMGTAVAQGAAIGSGMDPGPVGERARKSGEASRAELEQSMRQPMRRYMAYSYRDLSDADLKQLLAFLQSTAGKRYVAAYTASLDAGFNAMGKRCGEQLGESLRELAIAQLATESPNQEAVPDVKPAPDPNAHK